MVAPDYGYGIVAMAALGCGGPQSLSLQWPECYNCSPIFSPHSPTIRTSVLTYGALQKQTTYLLTYLLTRAWRQKRVSGLCTFSGKIRSRSRPWNKFVSTRSTVTVCYASLYSQNTLQ